MKIKITTLSCAMVIGFAGRLPALDSPRLTYDYFRLVEDNGWGDVWENFNAHVASDHTWQVNIREERDVVGAIGETQYWWNSDAWNFDVDFYCGSWFNSDYWWNQPGNPPSGGWWEGSTCGAYAAGELETNPDAETQNTVFEKCDVSHEFWSGSSISENYMQYHRFADSGTVMLHPSCVPQIVIFSPTAHEMVWDEGDQWWAKGPGIHPARIKLGEKPVDCNWRVAVQFTSLDPMIVTPSVINPPEWYKFALPFTTASRVALTRAFHPNISPAPTLASLQTKFNEVSAHLMVDSDTCIPDDDPSVQPEGNNYYSDGVPVYVDFEISDWRYGPELGAEFPSMWNGRDFTDPRFCNLSILEDLYELIREGNFAAVKMVSSMPPGNNIEAVGILNSMVVPVGVAPIVLAHEWGHTRGLDYWSETQGTVCEGHPPFPNSLLNYPAWSVE